MHGRETATIQNSLNRTENRTVAECAPKSPRTIVCMTPP